MQNFNGITWKIDKKIDKKIKFSMNNMEIWREIEKNEKLPLNTTRIKKKDAPGHLLIDQTKKIVQNFFHWKYFEDFQIFFQSRPIPGLYLKPFKR